ncbi:unnamed protein product [Zymoseptoria tritici ST99CH_1A5]|uniref:MARVEL domain-containing protein n=1 Tax=Zymoseptoria tritici ST99CH_1A5 TaxID=1276529 RepID=A0A1Y6LTY4_ZYMTR|nr:unnamed protein product [Zymoseptoria tritici ST99CH_1A5]
MSHDHHLQLPKFIWPIRIVQLVLSVIVLGLSAANVDVASFDAHAFAVFTSLFSIIILTYYLVAVHAVPRAYHWMAIVALELIAVVFWLATWAALAGLYADLVGGSRRSRNYYNIDRRSPEKRSIYSDYQGVFQAAIAFSVIQFVLFCVTAVFIGLAGWRRHSSGRSARGATTTPAVDLENRPETATVTNHHAPVNPNYTGT